MLCLLLVAPAPGAAVEVGSRPAARLARTSGAAVALADYRGKPAVLFYEDRRSTAVNEHVKERLFAEGRERGLLDAVHVLAVANLSAYDFPPARGIALAFLRRLERRFGIPMLVDLRGALSAAPWGLTPDTSSVVLLDARGTVRFVRSGRLADADVGRLFDMLAVLVGTNAGVPPALADPTPVF